MKTPIEITEVNVIPVKPQNGLIGFASMVVNENFYLGSIAIFVKSDGDIRLVFPKKNNLHCYHPINKSVGDLMTQHIKKVLNNSLTPFNYEKGKVNFTSSRT